MPSFNFSQFGGISSGASAASALMSQLQIKENQLASDGNLSPGDYDLLTSMAQKAANSPGLTAAERQELVVKVSGYQKAKSTSAISDKSNTTELNNNYADTMNTATMLRGNDPVEFAKAQTDSLAAKLSQLKDAIDMADSSGDTATSASLTNEWNSTLNSYNDSSAALQDITNYQQNPTGAPDSDYGAYITTNSKGEITGVQIARQGSVSGYTEVKALYGGLPIYGKVNSKTQGNDVFKLGNKTYTAPSFYYDSSNPNAKAILVDQSAQKGNYSNGANAPYVDMDSNTTSPQGYIPDGGWAQGATSSTWYQNEGGGKYTKYLGASAKGLQVPDGGYITLPNSMEQNITPAVAKTIDFNAQSPITPNLSSENPAVPATQPTSTAQQSSTAPQSTPPTTQSTPTSSVARTQAPVTRSPSTIGGLAQSAYNGATSFLGGLFGKGSSQQ